MTKKVDEVTVVEEVKEVNGTVDLLKIAEKTVGDLVESGFVQEKMEEHMKKAIESIMDDTFGRWSTFSKAVKKQLEEKMDINLDELGLASYNTMVGEMFKENFDKMLKTDGVDKLRETIEGFLKIDEKEITLSELMKKMKSAYQAKIHEDEGEDLGGLEISFHYKKYTSLTFIDFDGQEGMSSYECRYRMSVHNETGTINGLTIKGKEITNKTVMDGLYKFDNQMLQLFMKGTKIIMDPDNIDHEYEYGEDYDD